MAKSKPAAVIADNLLDDHRWKHTFIPTLTHALYISREPFVDWSIDSPAFLATVQKVSNLSFPNIDVNLSVNDKITNTVCQTDSQLV